MVGNSGGGFLAFFNLCMLALYDFDPQIVVTKEILGITITGGAVFALMAWSMAGKWMPFVRLAERVFTAFGWPDPGNVDLVKSTKAQRQPGDSGELGVFYFRY